MTLQQCYLEFGGTYEETLHRIRKERILEQLLDNFRKQEHISKMKKELRKGDRKQALSTLQVLRGENINLGLGISQKAMDELGELLKKKIVWEEVHTHLIYIQEEYDKVVNGLNHYFDSRS